MFFAVTAFAQTPGSNPAAAVGFDPMSLLPFVLIIVVFYFLIFRPQQKRMKQQKEMLSSLRRGDKVVTTGGIFGTVSRLENDQEVHVEIAPNVVIRLNRASVSDILTKTNVQPQGVESAAVKPVEAAKSPTVAKPAAKPSQSSKKPAAAKPVAKKGSVAPKKPVKK
ncbi:MAG: preprotein translocase subunit YajC [Alphaproteobacteria bacterium]|nr:preprotein translocase subunit YajC [Alphaproteobacteria bacterium]OJV46436.1 MAG: preprotein translocase subunit YajC [Alphaproteobacteria bacterium 43-37]